MTEADKVFSELFTWFNSRFAMLNSFLLLVKLGLSSTKPKALQKSKLTVDNFVKDLDVFPKQFLDAVGGKEGLATIFLDQHLANYDIEIRATAFVFLHSIIDITALKCLRVTALASPANWESFVSKKQVTLSEVKSSNYQYLLNNSIEKELKKLDRLSLLKKVDRLFQLCQPTNSFMPRGKYTFDRDRIEALDRKRHEIIHSYGPIPSLSNPECEVNYAIKTCMFFMSMVQKRYNLKLLPPNITDKYAENTSF